MKTRREILSIGVCAVASLVLPTLPASGHTIGVSEWNENHSDCRLYVDGIDRTLACFQCNVSEGWADCYILNERGGFINKDGFLEAKRHKGLVEILKKGAR